MAIKISGSISLILSFICALSAFGQAVGAPAPVTIQPITEKVLAGSTIQLIFYVGNDAAPVANLFGLGFEVHFDNGKYLQPVTPDQVQSGPFLEPNTYNFAKYEPDRSMVSLAVSRKLGDVGQSGHGEVLYYSFTIAENTPIGTVICFSLANVFGNDSVGTAVDVIGGPPMCITVADLEITVVPNPFTPNDDGSNDGVEFRREGGFPPEWTIMILDRSARMVRRLANGKNLWNGTDNQGRDMLPGIYLYLIQDGEEIIKRGVIGLVR